MTRTIGCALDTATATTRIWTRRASPSLSLFLSLSLSLSLSSSLVVTVLSFSSSFYSFTSRDLHTLSFSLVSGARPEIYAIIFPSGIAPRTRTPHDRVSTDATRAHARHRARIRSAPRRLTSATNFTRVAHSFVRSFARSLTRRSVSPPHLAFPATLRCVRSFCVDDKTRAGSQTADGRDLPAAAYFMHGATRMTTTATRYLTNAYRNGNKTYTHTHTYTRSRDWREVVRARTVATVATDTVLPPSTSPDCDQLQRPCAMQTNRLTVSGRPRNDAERWRQLPHGAAAIVLSNVTSPGIDAALRNARNCLHVARSDLAPACLFTYVGLHPKTSPLMPSCVILSLLRQLFFRQ